MKSKQSPNFCSKLLTVFILITVFIIPKTYSQAFQWAMQSGGPGVSSTSDRGEALAVDSQGNIIFTGTFEGTGTFGTTTLTSSGGLDIFIEKRSHDGNFLWAVKAGGTQGEYPKAIATDLNGNIFVTGNFSGTATFGTQTITGNSIDVFVAKYNSAGQLQWVQKAGGASVDRGLGIATDGAGNVIVVGDFSGSATFGTATNLTSAGAVDIFIAKYNPSGTLIWAKRAGGTVNDRATAVTTDSNGNIYLTGSFGGTANFDGTNITATGGAFDTDIFVAKYNSTGNIQWVKKGGTTGGDVEEAKAITLDALGNVYISGVFFNTVSFDGQTISSNGSSDAFVAKYNNAGNIQWLRNLGGSAEDEATSMSALPDGGICVAGFFKGSMNAGSLSLLAFGGASDLDGFIAKMDAAGNIKWLKRLGRVNEDKTNGIAADFIGRINATGFFRTNIAFDGLQLSAVGSSDAFLVQMNEFILFDTLSNLVFCAGDSLSLPFMTSIKFDPSNIFTLELSAPDGNFSNPIVLGTLLADTSDVFSLIIPDTLSHGNNYNLRIQASNPLAVSLVYHEPLTVNEKPLLPQLISQTSFCYGDTLFLMEANGNNIFWYSDSSLNNLLTNGFLFALDLQLLDDTLFYAIDISSQGCRSEIKNVNIIVNPLPLINYSGPDTVILCNNDCAWQINVIPTGGVFIGNGIIPPDFFAPNIAAVGVHDVQYVYTDANLCSAAAYIYFEVLEAPIVTIDTLANIQIQYFDTLFLSGTPAGGTFSGTGVTDSYFIGVPNDACQPCIIYYIYTALNGCTDTATINVTNYVNAIPEKQSADIFNVYPNPFYEHLYVNIKNSDNYEIALYDAYGREVRRFAPRISRQFNLNLQELNCGLYYMVFSNEKDVFIKKILKTK